MFNNVGTIDKTFRIVLGIIFISQVFVGFQTPLGWVGVILVATGLINFCPIYKIIGFKTSSSSDSGSDSDRKAA